MYSSGSEEALLCIYSVPNLFDLMLRGGEEYFISQHTQPLKVYKIDLKIYF